MDTQNYHKKLSSLIEHSLKLKRLGGLIHHPDYKLLLETTAFLKNATIAQRLWHVINNCYNIQTCKICNSPVSWRQQEKRYSTYCSSKCAHNDPEVLNKTNNTVLKKYNVKHISQSEIVKNARINTNLARYGVKNSFWVNRTREDVSSTYFKERNMHDINQVKQLINQQLSQQEIGNIIGITQPRVSSLLNKTGLKTTTITKSSSIQRSIEQHLDTINVDYITNANIISPYDVDIYIPQYKIAIEINGIYWHSELAGKTKNYHLNKTLLCEKNGIRLIHIWDVEWIHKTDLVLSRLNSILQKNKTLGARECSVQRIDYEQAAVFLEQTHIQGSCSSSFVNYGLFKDGTLMAVATFAKPRYNTSFQYELLRYSTALNWNIAGGLSRLFKTFIKEYNPSSVITYCDRRWNSGNLYKQIGFTYIGCSAPNYLYFYRNGNTTKVFSRIKFQKHKLSKILPNFDPNLTEWENMKNNGYDRIWDCGNTKWGWTAS